MKMAALAAGKNGCIDLTLGEPDIATPIEICEALAKAARGGETHYAPGMGLPGLRSAVCEYWRNKYALDYGADEIFVTTGGSQAAFLAMQACLDPGDEVIILEPFFTFYEQHVLQAGGIPIYCMSGVDRGFIPDPREIEKKITPRTKAMIVNSPCNPTGALFSKETLSSLARIAEEHDLMVVSDELYEAFAYHDGHVPFASLPGMRKRTLTIGGMSKSYAMTGWRIGYVMGDTSVLKVMQTIGVVQTISVNTMAQRASEFAIRSCGKRVDEIASLFRSRVKYAYEAFGSIPGVKTSEPGGSFYLFLNVSGTGMDGGQFALKILEEAGVVLIPGDSFGPHCGDYVRIACTAPEATLMEAAKRVRHSLRSVDV